MKEHYLDNTTLEKLNKARERWATILKKAEKVAADEFSVVIIGQQNNGKSTLCNALLEDWSNQRFAVSDTRQTEVIQEDRNTTSGITYVDTPGFGTSWASDTNRAQEEWYRANLIIFVHSVRSGELDLDEVSTLHKLKSIVPQLEQRLFVVCSKFGEEERQYSTEVQYIVKNQITQIISDIIPVENIDSLFYQQGKSINDFRLVKYSNMETLLKWIDNHKYISSPYEEIFENERKLYLNTLISIQNIFNSNIDKLHTRNSYYCTELKRCWNENKKQIKNSYNICALYS